MKRLLAIAAMTVLLACGGGGADEMRIDGNVQGLKKGTIFLQHIDRDSLVTLDSVVLDGSGRFRFAVPVSGPEIFYLYLAVADNNEINDRVRFFGESGDIRVQTSWTAFEADLQVQGTQIQKDFEEYNDLVSAFNKRDLELLQQTMVLDAAADSLAIDSLQRLSDRNVFMRYSAVLNYALNHGDSHLSPYIVVHDAPNAGTVYLDSVWNGLSPSVRESKYGAQLGDLIAERKQE